jgi:hypothetical protein
MSRFPQSRIDLTRRALASDIEDHQTFAEASLVIECEMLDEIEYLRGAIGLATTVMPASEVDVNDPVVMMQQVADLVKVLRGIITKLEQQVDKRGVMLEQLHSTSRKEAIQKAITEALSD